MQIACGMYQRALSGLLGAALMTGAAIAQDFTTYKGHGGPIMGLAVTPDGTMASASFDNSVGIWPGPTWLEGHEAAVIAVTFAPDGTPITGGDDFAIRIWGETPAVLGRHKGKVTSLAVSPDGQTLASGSWDGSATLWSIETFEETALPYPGAGVNAVAFTPDGAALYAATSRGVLLRYDLSSFEMRPILRHGFGINKLIVTADWIAYGAVDGGTRVVDLEGVPIKDFTLDRRPILSMAFDPGTNRLAVGDGHGYITMIDTEEWRITRDFRAMRKGPVWALAFSPDGNVIHAGGLDDVIYAWPVALLSKFKPAEGQDRSFLKAAGTMGNGERQFMRKCSICHALDEGPSRKAGPTLHGVFGRRAGTVPGYRYSATLANSSIVWSDDTIDLLFDQGPDHYIPGSKMPMQVIAQQSDRDDLIDYMRGATQ